MTFPVVNGRITQEFKPTHLGIDIAPPKPGDTNTPCLAPETSTVIASASGKVEGNYVILQGLQTGMFYYFGHFSERKVSAGRGIAEGTVIGILGKTGQATGIHTHHWIRKTRYGGYVDPQAYYKEKGADMHDGKTAKEWYEIANDWHKRADDRQEVIKRLENEVQALKKQVGAEYVPVTEPLFRLKKG